MPQLYKSSLFYTILVGLIAWACVNPITDFVQVDSTSFTTIEADISDDAALSKVRLTSSSNRLTSQFSLPISKATVSVTDQNGVKTTFTEGIPTGTYYPSAGFKGAVGAAEIRVSPDGKHVYVSNRGEANTISVFGKKPDGSYTRVQNIPSGGLMPRNFNLTGDGKYLLAAHQASHDIVIFERDSISGILSLTPWKANVHKPVYLHRLPN